MYAIQSFASACGLLRGITHVKQITSTFLEALITAASLAFIK
jgi:hypothetical protein